MYCEDLLGPAGFLVGMQRPQEFDMYLTNIRTLIKETVSMQELHSWKSYSNVIVHWFGPDEEKVIIQAIDASFILIIAYELEGVSNEGEQFFGKSDLLHLAMVHGF